MMFVDFEPTYTRIYDHAQRKRVAAQKASDERETAKRIPKPSPNEARMEFRRSLLGDDWLAANAIAQLWACRSSAALTFLTNNRDDFESKRGPKGYHAPSWLWRKR